MSNKDFTVTILVDETPMQVYNAINNVRGWWSEEIEGSTDKLNAEWLYRFKDVHICKMKITELTPGKRVTWLVLENHFNFVSDNSEWKGNEIIFDISKAGDKTQLTFTHVGLVSQYECYDVCFEAWTNYITHSLRNLIATGKGEPNPKEGVGYNTELAEKWNILQS